MRTSDLDAVADIEREAFPRPWGYTSLRNELERPPAAGTSAEERADGVPRGLCRVVAGPDGIAAYVIAWFIGEDVHIARIAVAGGARRTGRGRALMRDLLATARLGGARHVLLEVREDNEAAIALYGSLGFVAVGTRHGYYEDAGGRRSARLLLLTLEREAPGAGG
jgi:ribosomal protein S18 acetylase RimI-like enzyme